MSQGLRTANCALLRYDRGHVYVDRSAGHQKREIYVELKGVKDEDHAADIGLEILRLHALQRETFNISGTVLQIQQLPGAAFHLGDDMDGQRVVGFTVSGDNRGYAKVIPTLGDPVQIRLAAMDRRLARASAGVAGEFAAPVINSQSQGEGTDTTPPEFSLSGELEPSFSPVWKVPRPWHCSWLQAQLRVAGSTATRVNLYETSPGGTTTAIATLTLAAGDKEVVIVVNHGYATHTKLVLACVSAGVGAQDLTVTPRGAMV